MAFETGLPSRYEIRTLGPEHIDWADAIVCHSNMFSSPVWPILLPENKTGRCYGMFKAANYLVRHQIDSGLSLGVFDKEYQFKRPESAATGGKLYWDLDNEAADRSELLEQMDFPLVSVALAYDASNPLDMAELVPIIAIGLPFDIVYGELAARDLRDVNTVSEFFVSLYTSFTLRL